MWGGGGRGEGGSLIPSQLPDFLALGTCAPQSPYVTGFCHQLCHMTLPASSVVSSTCMAVICQGKVMPQAVAGMKDKRKYPVSQLWAMCSGNMPLV